jgi:DEAD/DEAH box helicase domain-containing protein
MLDLIYKVLGFRVKLDDLAYMTLNKQKTGDGLQSIQWWKEGKVALIEQYCRQDVTITKELYEFGQSHGVIYYSSRYRKTSLRCPW